jgi:hypothetical protein
MQVFVVPKDTDAIGNKNRGLKRFQVVINYMEITIDTECNHISEFKEFKRLLAPECLMARLSNIQKSGILITKGSSK